MENNINMPFVNLYGGIYDVPTRNVDNGKFCDALFAPLSKKSICCNKTHLDDCIYGYVEDDVFFNYNDEDFEKYVMKYFD